MAYKVRIVKGNPEYDALPVAKVAGYPLEKRDYRPFAQNALCLGSDKLCLRMWAFETSPAEGSEMRGVFYLFKDKPETALHIRVSARGDSFPAPYAEAFLEECGVRVLDIPVSETRPHSGEDLQGVYWGASVSVSLGELKKAGDILSEPGDVFRGNFYKTSASGTEHYGSFYPADFTADPYSPDSMGELELVDY